MKNFVMFTIKPQTNLSDLFYLPSSNQNSSSFFTQDQMEFEWVVGWDMTKQLHT